VGPTSVSVITLRHGSHTAGYATVSDDEDEENWHTMFRNGYATNTGGRSYFSFQCQGCNQIVTRDVVTDGDEVEE